MGVGKVKAEWASSQHNATCKISFVPVCKFTGKTLIFGHSEVQMKLLDLRLSPVIRKSWSCWSSIHYFSTNQSTRYCSYEIGCNPSLSSPNPHPDRAFFENVPSRQKPKQFRVGQKIHVRVDWNALCLKLKTHLPYSLLEPIVHLKSVCAT